MQCQTLSRRVVAERASQNPGLAQWPVQAAETEHSPEAVLGTPLAFGHYIVVELGAESELALESAHALQKSWVVSRLNSWAAQLSDADGSQWGRLLNAEQTPPEQKQVERTALHKSGLAAQMRIEWVRKKQAPNRTGSLAVRWAFVPRLGSASLRRKASWIAPWPSPSLPKR